MIPTSIIKKIREVSMACPSLKKSDRAEAAGFNYVSIDTYYQEIASIALEKGLVWVISEENIEIDEDHTLQTQTFLVSVYDAESGEGAPDMIRMSITHPFQEAQTTGSSVSYADKLVMRQLFKVVTGEKDADHFAKARPAKGASNAQKQQTQPPATRPSTQNETKAPKQSQILVETASDPEVQEGEEGTDVDDSEGIDSAGVAAAFSQARSAPELSKTRLTYDETVRQLKSKAAKGDKVAVAGLELVQSAYKKRYNQLNGTEKASG